MNANEMIERYVHEVGQHLPRKTRADIVLELRSLLLDTLEERSAGEPTPQIAAALLREFGHPEEMAAQYHQTEYLIGPKLFPTYKTVITITLSIIGGLHLLGLGFVLWQESGANFVSQLFDFIFAFARSAILNAGIVTLIFALIERVGTDSVDLPKKAKMWDPFALPPVKDPNRVDRPELAVGIFFGLLFVFWLNLLATWFGESDLSGDAVWIVQLTAAAFVQMIPWMTASLLAEVVLKGVVLLQGRWQRLTRWLEIATLSFGLYVTYRIYRLDEISTVPIFTTGIKLILGIIILVSVIELTVKLLKLLWGQSFTPPTLFDRIRLAKSG